MSSTFQTGLLIFGFFSSLASAAPNIIFILADDLGYGDLSCYGAPDIKTPNLDRLAQEGIRFTEFYSNGAICSPTRVAFLTGRYQQRYGMENALYYQEFGRGLPVDGQTVADRLSEAGYATGISGKWHVGYDPERQPMEHGFDHFFGLLGGNHHYFEHMDRIGVPDLWLGSNPVEREGYSTDLITDDAVAFIESHQEDPFFLYLSHAAPHFPWQGPDDVDKDIQPKKKSWQEGDRETYVAMVESMDSGIGKVLDRLGELGLSENTLVVFTSDNGGSTYSRNAPMRGEKSTLWEGGIRVPCIARWPNHIPAGTTSAQVGITMDWTATFAHLAGIEITPEEFDGIDLLPLLSGSGTPIHRTIYWRSRPGPKRKSVERRRAVRDGTWKLLETESEGTQLFDLQADIEESSNLLADHPQIAEQLRKQLDSWENTVIE